MFVTGGRLVRVPWPRRAGLVAAVLVAPFLVALTVSTVVGWLRVEPVVGDFRRPWSDGRVETEAGHSRCPPDGEPISTLSCIVSKREIRVLRLVTPNGNLVELTNTGPTGVGIESFNLDFGCDFVFAKGGYIAMWFKTLGDVPRPLRSRAEFLAERTVELLEYLDAADPGWLGGVPSYDEVSSRLREIFDEVFGEEIVAENGVGPRSRRTDGRMDVSDVRMGADSVNLTVWWTYIDKANPKITLEITSDNICSGGLG